MAGCGAQFVLAEGDSLLVRPAWLVGANGGPCYFDTDYNVELCLPEGLPSGNSQYFSAPPNPQVLPDNARFKTVLCPVIGEGGLLRSRRAIHTLHCVTVCSQTRRRHRRRPARRPR